jgi:hypothetical protein
LHESLLLSKNISRCNFGDLAGSFIGSSERDYSLKYSTRERERTISRSFVQEMAVTSIKKHYAFSTWEKGFQVFDIVLL